MTDALFTINADSSNQGFDSAPASGETLTFRLKTLPVSGVSSVLFQVYSSESFDASLGIARNPPRASNGAPILVLYNDADAEGQSVSPVAVDGSVYVDMPISGAHSWIVRCVVNGGMGRLADGRIGVRRDFIHERMVVIRNDKDLRKIIASETTQYSDDGWAQAINEMIDVMENCDCTPPT